MRIAAYQMDITIGQLAKNLVGITDRMQKAAKAGVGLVVFPECALSGYCFDSRPEAKMSGVELDGPEVQMLTQTAKALGIYATVGLIEIAGDKLYNSQVLVGPEGLLGSYRKIHLPHLGVDRFVDPGDLGPVVLNAGDAKIGMAVCYDSTFPELSRSLSLEGADIIALSTNWPAAATRVAQIVPPCRSFENQVFFVAANRIGKERSFEFCGLSSIHGPPDGTCYIAADGAKEELLIADIDLAKARNKRIERTVGKHVVDLFADRRPQYYDRVSRNP